jgi:hypothetical protein
MPGRSARTRVAAVRLTDFGFEVLDALAAKNGWSRSEAHKRALRAGCNELLGAMKVAKIRERYTLAESDPEDPGVNTDVEM